MKKLKIFTDIEESYNELVYKVSWPTKSQLVESSIVVMAVVEDEALSQLVSSKQSGSASKGRVQRLIAVIAAEE